jgi:hypothetical protein
MQKTQQFTNPFQWLAAHVPSTDIPLDLPMLGLFAKELAKYGVHLSTYGDIYKVLEYLEEHNVIKLTRQTGSTALIRRTY